MNDSTLDSVPVPRAGEFLVPSDARETTCRSCGKPVAFVLSSKGRQVPVSLETVVERDGGRFALSHFSDCPDAKHWSHKTSKR